MLIKTCLLDMAIMALHRFLLSVNFDFLEKIRKWYPVDFFMFLNSEFPSHRLVATKG